MPRTSATLPVTNIVFEHSEGSPADFLLGSINIAGQPFHAIAVRVVERNNIQGVPTNASVMARVWYEAMQVMDAGFKHTVRIPKHPGNWTLVISPYTE